MKILKKRPPNYDVLARAFGPLPKNAVFAYGDSIFCEISDELPADLVEHEATHLRQQADAGGPDAWWGRYIADPEFRLEQEVEAYRNQIASHADRPSRRQCWRRVSKDLASPMYGNLVTKQQARELLRDAA